MIAEFKQFSGLTPKAFVNGGYFRPFQSLERQRPVKHHIQRTAGA
jgi:hypothetical protein